MLPTGLIYIEVSDLVLASWLQHFIDNRSGEGIEVNYLALKADSVFSIQYIHARCCSLLRLAQQEKLLDTNKIASESIPWLNASGQLCLNHQAERRLINNLVKVVDELEPAITRPLKWEGAALSLLKAFENFWSACRICGTSTTPTEVIMARVGLIMTTRTVLKFLLEEKLGIPACSEL
ncbi:MAG: DALR anticodon-binding domain-containing protein [Rivularia sp. (in: cyanobacteria)]